MLIVPQFFGKICQEAIQYLYRGPFCSRNPHRPPIPGKVAETRLLKPRLKLMLSKRVSIHGRQDVKPGQYKLMESPLTREDLKMRVLLDRLEPLNIT